MSDKSLDLSAFLSMKFINFVKDYVIIFLENNRFKKVPYLLIFKYKQCKKHGVYFPKVKSALSKPYSAIISYKDSRTKLI